MRYTNRTIRVSIPYIQEAMASKEEFEDSMVFAKSSYSGAPLRNVYNPFFIRNSDTKKFVLEKMQNCIVKRMMILQKRWQKKQENK